MPSLNPHNKHSNIQYQFLAILHSQDPHNKHSNVKYQFLSTLSFTNIPTNTVIFSISSSLYCHPQNLTTNTVTVSISSSLYCIPQDHQEKHSNIQYFFFSILPSPEPHNNTVIICISSSIYCPSRNSQQRDKHSFSVPLHIALPRTSQQTQ